MKFLSAANQTNQKTKKVFFKPLNSAVHKHESVQII